MQIIGDKREHLGWARCLPYWSSSAWLCHWELTGALSASGNQAGVAEALCGSCVQVVFQGLLLHA